MKLYKFYKNPSDEVLENCSDLTIEEKYPLYAFTANKKYAQKFMETRDMQKFIKRVSNIDKDDYKEFTNSNRGRLLEFFDFIHFKGYTDDACVNKEEKVTILTTWEERELTSASADDGITDLTEYVDYNFFPFIFKGKFVKALDCLQYISHWKCLGSSEKFSQLLLPDEADEYMDYVSPSIKIDEFSIYILLFGDTYKS